MKNQIRDIEEFLMGVEEDLSHLIAVNSMATSVEERMTLDDAITPETVKALVFAVRAASRWALPAESLSKGIGKAMLQDIRNKLNGT